MLPQQSHSQVEDQESVSFKEKDFPKLIHQCEFHYSSEKRHEPISCEHLIMYLQSLQMQSYLLVMVVQQELHQEQRTLQVWQTVTSTIILSVECIWNVQLYEPFEITIDISQIIISNSFCIAIVYVSYELLLLHQEKRHEDFDHTLTIGDILRVAIVFQRSMHICVKLLVIFQEFSPLYIFVNLLSIELCLVSWLPKSEIFSCVFYLRRLQDLFNISHSLIVEGKLFFLDQYIQSLAQFSVIEDLHRVSSLSRSTTSSATVHCTSQCPLRFEVRRILSIDWRAESIRCRVHLVLRSVVNMQIIAWCIAIRAK